MKNVIVASKNPVKLQAVSNGFQRMFPETEFAFLPQSAPSGVSEQPMTDKETLDGAMNRVAHISEAHPGADFWVGVEGGIEDRNAEMTAFAWIVVKSQSITGKGRTGAFFLPEKIAALVRDGKELGEADDIVFQQSNSKQRSGAIGLLTDNVITRTSLYEHAVILALVPFKNLNLY